MVKLFEHHFARRLSSGGFVAIIGVVSFAWLVWQTWGIEVMRIPWEDEILYTLPAVNWIRKGVFAIPQLGNFAGANSSWGWHVPGFSLGLAAWLLLFPLELWAIRLYTLLAAVSTCAILIIVAYRTGAAGSILTLSAWISVVYFDKSIVSQSVQGRMEFHAVLFLLSSIILLTWLRTSADRRRVGLYAGCAGFLFGTSLLFHPITIYFAPAFLVASITSPAMREAGLIRSLTQSFAASLLPLAAMGVWFMIQGPTAIQQFMMSATGSSASGTKGSLLTISEMLLFAYRFQPAVIGALLLVIFIFLQQALSGMKMGWRFESFPLRLLVSSIAASFCFFGAMLRGSTQNLNYYVIFSVFFLLAFIAAFCIAAKSGARGIRLASLAILLLLALNNLAFAVFKTYVVESNLAAWNKPDMSQFLSPLAQKPTGRFVLPPNLWLWAEQNDLNWRVSYLPLIGQPTSTYAGYHQLYLDWNPTQIILDESDWRDRSIASSTLQDHGYFEEGCFSKVFSHRGPYAGWRLHLYTSRP